jgi:predicted alpha/beta-hydrolase family hydrolase
VTAERFAFYVVLEGMGPSGSKAQAAVDSHPKTTALLYRASRPGGAHAAIVLAHGAGAPQTHPWMVRMAGALAARGLDVVTFNFLYAEARRRVPDKAPVLEATWRAAIDAVRARPDVAQARLFIGGKSMGGRFATMVAASGGASLGIAGLVLLGYPLHPPGRPDKLRAEHLARVSEPMLFVQGSRDTFGSPDELAPFVAPLATRGTRVFPVVGGDHSLVPPKSSGEDVEHVVARVADEIARFTA